MKRILFPIALGFGLAACAAAAQAQCYAEYKAKRDNPLELHYGIAQVSSCSASEASGELQPRLAADGWRLLKVIAVIDEGQLDERRKSRAGQYYLRY